MGQLLKILLVDDLVAMRKLIRELLKHFGYENIIEAEDGVLALRILKAQKIDFIISDWNMPNMTGIELLKAVRADADLKKTPFLMVTAEAFQDNIAQAVEVGVSDYIAKPFSAAILKDKITKLLARL